MVEERILIPPRRDEQLVSGGGLPEPRFINFLEEISAEVEAISKDIINIEGTVQVVITGTYQTSGNTVVICEGPSTITLDPSATDGTRVTVKRMAGQVTITSIALIDESSDDLILSRDRTGIDLVFVRETSSWYIR